MYNVPPGRALSSLAAELWKCHNSCHLGESSSWCALRTHLCGCFRFFSFLENFIVVQVQLSASPPPLFPLHPSHPHFLPLIQVLKVTLAVVSMQKESIEILFNNHQGLFIYLNAWWKTLIMQILLLYRSGKCSLISESEYKRFQEGSMRA